MTASVVEWPTDPEALVDLQNSLGVTDRAPWEPSHSILAGGCFICFPRWGTGAGVAGDRAWAAAVVMHDRRVASLSIVSGQAGASYAAGLLAAREGALLAEAVASLEFRPEVLLVNATGRDHPRRAGLAVQLGWALDVPTVGVTHRPLLATGEWPELRRGARRPLVIDGEEVGAWLCTRSGARPLAVSAGWGTTPEVAVRVVEQAGGRMRTPEPIRRSRTLARLARAVRSTDDQTG